MKIVFVCGSLEEGKDGVGDYSRRLAGEVIRLGHQVSIISLMDKFVETQIEEVQYDEINSILVLRIPFKKNNKSNFSVAKAWIDKLNPDWISLQYVSYSFNNRGFPFYFGNKFSKITHKHNLHIMFHELWVGLDEGCSKKDIIFGFIQRLMIRDLIKKTAPKLITTQSFLYSQELSKLEINPYILPLFSNIKRIGIEGKPQNSFKKFMPHSSICFGVFGTIHEKNNIRLFAGELKEFCNKYHIEARLILIGRGGKNKDFFATICQQNKITITAHEEISSEEVSKLLLSLDFGITTSNYTKIDKSGSVVAMLEHGLSVISLAEKVETNANALIKSYLGKKFCNIYEYTQGELENFLLSERIIPEFEGLNVVSDQLLSMYDEFNQN